MRLIDKDSLIEHMRKAYKGNTKAGFKWDLVSTVAVIGAEEEITPDTEPIRHGHWIYGQCSVCGEYPLTRVKYRGEEIWNIQNKYKYCPFCGAKMDEVE